MDPTNLDKFKLISCRIREAIPSSFSWSWDEDFDVARIVFHKSEMDPLLMTLEKEFHGKWDFTSIDSAPASIENYIHSIFGIIPGQILFTAGENSGPILFAVWWPWGNENYISLRIGIFSPNEEDFSKNESKKFLKKWIGL